MYNPFIKLSLEGNRRLYIRPEEITDFGYPATSDSKTTNVRTTHCLYSVLEDAEEIMAIIQKNMQDTKIIDD